MRCSARGYGLTRADVGYLEAQLFGRGARSRSPRGRGGLATRPAPRPRGAAGRRTRPPRRAARGRGPSRGRGCQARRRHSSARPWTTIAFAAPEVCDARSRKSHFSRVALDQRHTAARGGRWPAAGPGNPRPSPGRRCVASSTCGKLERHERVGEMVVETPGGSRTVVGARASSATSSRSATSCLTAGGGSSWRATRSSYRPPLPRRRPGP